MSLRNLLKIGSLAEHTTDARQVGQMLVAASRSLGDARQKNISPETRLDAAYRSIMQAAMVALWANGYRPARNVPGHHSTMIQSLTHSINLDKPQMLVLDTFRVKRNAIDYTGMEVEEVTVDACIEAADNLLRHLDSWLSENQAQLL